MFQSVPRGADVQQDTDLPQEVLQLRLMQGQQAYYLDTRLFSYRSELLLHQNCLMFIFRDLWTVCWHAMGPTKISTAGNVTFYNCRCLLSLLLLCRGCYGKKFGAKGYGFAGGSGFLQTGDL